MTETLSIQLDAETNQRLEALSRLSNRAKSVLAEEAIAAYVESEEWELSEIQAAAEELDRGEGVPHEAVAKWLRSWGTEDEMTAPQ